jgi:hypothetical protein
MPAAQAMDTFCGSRVFQPSSAARTFCPEASKVKEGSGDLDAMRIPVIKQTSQIIMGSHEH